MLPPDERIRRHKARKRKYSKRWYHANKKKAKASQKKWYNKNQLKLKQYRKQYYRKNKARTKAINRNSVLKHFGLTLESYNKMLMDQNFRCYICRVKVKRLKKSLAVDHDHKTGKVRGLLCNTCNIVLGLVKESTMRLGSMIDYLVQHAK